MPQKTNILIFDEAKYRVKTGYRCSNESVNFEEEYPLFESPFRQTQTRTSVATTTRIPSKSFPEHASGAVSSLSAISKHSCSLQVGRRATANLQHGRIKAQNRDDIEDGWDKQHQTCFDGLRKKCVKAKAGRAFTKQYGGASQKTDAEANSPRAAVYKGEMGAKHKRAARMQNNSTLKGSNIPGFSWGKLRLLKSPKFITTACIVACLALSCVFLYPSAQQYYHAVREHDRLTAEYAALEERNEALQNNVSALQTDAGIEARAHEQFGWVKQDEETACVRGLGLEEEGTGAFYANILPESITAPETWYSPFLDAFFGVE